MSNNSFLSEWTPEMREGNFRFAPAPAGAGRVAGYLDAVIVDQGLTLSPIQNRGSHIAIARSTGMIPRVGQQWLIMSTAATMGQGAVELRIGQHQELLRIRFSDTALVAEQGERVYLNPLQAGAKKFLMLFDFHPGKMRFRLQASTAGLTVNLVDVDLPEEDSQVGLVITAHLVRADRDFSLRFNRTQAQNSPTTIPSGAIPIRAAHAATPPQDGFYRSSTGGAYDSYVFRAGSLHVVADGRITPLLERAVLEPQHNAQIDGQWSFREPVRLQDHILQSKGDVVALATERPSERVVGPLVSIGTGLSQTQKAEHAQILGHFKGPMQYVVDATLIGDDLQKLGMAWRSVWIGHGSAPALKTLHQSTIMGQYAFQGLEASYNATVVGSVSLENATELKNSTFIGQDLMNQAGRVLCSVHIGQDHGRASRHSSGNVWVGRHLGQQSDLQHSVLIGKHIVADTRDRTIGFMALGYRAGFLAHNHAMAIGDGAQSAGDYAIQIGGPQHRIDTHRGVSVRADERDVLTSRPTSLGLEFIMNLQPKEVRWNYRDMYMRDIPLPPAPLRARPLEPSRNDQVAYQDYVTDLDQWLLERDISEQENRLFHTALAERRHQLSLMRKEHRTNRADTHFEQTLLAQDVLHAAEASGQSFAGARLTGGRDGLDVAAVRPDQIIPPLVRAVQELNSPERQEELIERVALRVLELIETTKSTT